MSIHWTCDETSQAVEDFRSLDIETLRGKYDLDKDSRDWTVAGAKADVIANTDSRCFQPILYRHFDTRYAWYSGKTRGFMGTPGYPTSRHMLYNENKAVICLRQTRRGETGTFFVGRGLINKDAVSIFDIATIFPLYLYDTQDQGLFATTHRPNFTPSFITQISSCLKMQFILDGKGDREQTFGPEDIFSYMYAVFNSPTYKNRYSELLKIDFPRLPITSNPDLFRELCLLGDDLVALHLMEKHAIKITSYPVAGDSTVDKVKYQEPLEGIKGRVWINAIQYFEGVPKEVWEFHVGGYQVCDKWLKDRKGRQLTYDDLTHYQNIVAALAETIRLMVAVDEAINGQGGWPIK